MILKMSEIITPKFHDLFNSKEVFNIAKGGRSSGKSTTIGFRIPIEMIQHKIDVLIVRKVFNTMKDSVYNQILEAINVLGLSHKFKATISPLQITYIPTGQRILFRGADKPERIKSIKSKFPIGIVWIEELAEFKTFDEVNIILDSIIRAEGYYKVFMSYNPPKRKNNWCNKMFESKINIPKHTFIHHSTSFDNPYQGKIFLEKAEEWKIKDYNYYKWNYEGEPIGGGIVPFSNLEFRTITDGEIISFDNILQGLDWGFSVDPLAFTRMHYDKTRRELYIFGEIYKVKMHNVNLSEVLKKRKWNDTRIIADSAEPKSVSDLCTYGLKCYGAKKGQGSVEYGLEWLDSLNKIVIDPVRCPNTANEFESADYDLDRNGNVIPKLVGADHAIDSVRYATEDIQQNKHDFYPKEIKKWRFGGM